MYKPWAWDWMAAGAGIAALLCGASTLLLDSFGPLWALQWATTLASLVTGLIGWRGGSKSLILVGIGCAFLSWIPYLGLLASCFLYSDCL